MSVYTKTLIAFSLSLAVTLGLAWGVRAATDQIVLEQNRLHLAEDQLRELLSAKNLGNDHLMSALRELSLDPSHNPGEARSCLKQTQSLIRRLLTYSEIELAELHDLSESEANRVKEEEEAEHWSLAELQEFLFEAERHLDELIVSSAQGDHDAVLDEFTTIYVDRFESLYRAPIEELIADELSQVLRRKARLDGSIDVIRAAALWAALAGVAVVAIAALVVRGSLDLIKRAAEQERAANRAKSTFLANMSHEIRTPLNGVLGFTKILMSKQGDLDETENQHCLATIHGCGKHLLQLINDILDLSKIEAGRLECRPRSCDPAVILEEVVSVLKIRAESAAISLDLEWETPPPASIVTDPARLKQVLINLVGNAVKFTLRGGVRVAARTERREGVDLLIVDVHDTGLGVPEDKLEAIFDPFQQVEDESTSHIEGTGLGLSISVMLAELLGGGVTAVSTADQGSTFTLTVTTGPLVAPAKGAQLRAAKITPEAGGPLDLTGVRVLVVDDNSTNRMLLRMMLGGEGAEILEEANGLAGLEAALREEPAVVLMDVQMPVLDGLAATRRLRDAGFKAPILALTAHAMDGDMERCLEVGCNGYLPKPINRDDLFRELAKRLGSQSEESAVEPNECLPPLDEVAAVE
ncbi:Autoinducer 2 sensor kinase/phosphatase LuxQ [Pseudobythopirellula maris]|uniref:histidine kinase n=1 Tax=Pseudobythopirellula maris TaxID=2527991 RepID=A0A5C5ZNT0_9BACT|nr:response regulator [Pseudobythopirellula maris]TWT89109.1 Autoinducer 2 sensor kinase/phosphatase LuxQ [Pseudobythopirellula maris]